MADLLELLREDAATPPGTAETLRWVADGLGDLVVLDDWQPRPHAGVTDSDQMALRMSVLRRVQRVIDELREQADRLDGPRTPDPGASA